MYFVINKTKNPVIIADIKFELKPKQAIDMDIIYARHQIESSRDLKTAIAQGVISVRHENRKKNKDKDTSHSSDSDEISKLKKEIREEIKSQMGDIADAIRENKPTSQPVEHSVKVEQPDQQELLGALANLTKVMENLGVGVQSVSPGQQIETDNVSEDIDPAIAEQIHAKAVDKMAEGLTSKVKYEEKKSKDDVIGDRVDELDKLMGD